MLARHETASPLDPNHENGAQAKNRAGNRGGEQGENREFDAEKSAYHRHQLNVSEAHALYAARP